MTEEQNSRVDGLKMDEFSDPRLNGVAPPGQFMRRLLHTRNISQVQLAQRTGLSTKTVSQIALGMAPLTPDTAVRLERALGRPSGEWLTLEAAYQNWQTQQKASQQLAQHASWLQHFPMAALQQRGIVAKEGLPGEQVGQLLSFFQVADPAAYDDVWSSPVASGFRRSQHHNIDPFASSIWLRLGEIEAERLEEELGVLPDFDGPSFTALLPHLKELTKRTSLQEAFAELQRRCFTAGVFVVFVPEVSGSRACGAARWLSPTRPIIVLSARNKKADGFWFSFFHEAAHLLLHSKREIYMDTGKAEDDFDGYEGEANRHATRTLLGTQGAKALRQQMTAAEIHALAERAGVSVAIVAGQLAHRFNDYKRMAPFRRQGIDL